MLQNFQSDATLRNSQVDADDSALTADNHLLSNKFFHLFADYVAKVTGTASAVNNLMRKISTNLIAISELNSLFLKSVDIL